MPTDQRVRFHDSESVFPIAQPRPQYQGKACCIRERSGLQLVFLIEGQLLSQEQILGE